MIGNLRLYDAVQLFDSSNGRMRGLPVAIYKIQVLLDVMEYEAREAVYGWGAWDGDVPILPQSITRKG